MTNAAFFLGTALDLALAHGQYILCSLTFNLIDYLQSQDRIHRISQQQVCEIVLLIAQNTVDEFIDFALEQKHRVAQFAQMDSAGLAIEDMLMLKPDEIQNLIQAL